MSCVFVQMGSGRLLLTVMVMALNLLKGLMSTPAVPLSDGLKLEQELLQNLK